MLRNLKQYFYVRLSLANGTKVNTYLLLKVLLMGGRPGAFMLEDISFKTNMLRQSEYFRL